MRPTRFATLDEDLLCSCGLPDLALSDPERVGQIAAELTAGFEAMVGVTQAVSIFGSARAASDSAEYALARAVAAALGRAGFSIITGAGPGLMEAANRGARDVGARSIGLNIELPQEQAVNPYVDLILEFRHFFARKVMFVRYASAFVVLRVLAPGRVDVDDLALLHLTDDPDEACRIVTCGHAAQLSTLRPTCAAAEEDHGGALVSRPAAPSRSVLSRWQRRQRGRRLS